MLTQQKSFEQILSTYRQGKTALVVELCKKHLRRFRNDYVILAEYGIVLGELHRYVAAEKVLRRAIALSPKRGLQFSFAQLGHLFQAKGDFNKAENWYRRACRAKPKSATYHIFLGSHLFKQGRLKEAEACFRRAIKCSEGCIEEAYFNLGGIMLASGRYAEALKCYQKALRIDPDYALAKKRLKDVKLAIALKNSN